MILIKWSIMIMSEVVLGSAVTPRVGTVHWATAAADDLVDGDGLSLSVIAEQPKSEHESWAHDNMS